MVLTATTFFMTIIEGPVTTPAPGEGSCPLTWQSYGPNCYYFEVNDEKSWLGAQHECVRMNKQGDNIVSNPNTSLVLNMISN